MTPYAETLLVSLLAEQRKTNELLERLLAERAQSHPLGDPHHRLLEEYHKAVPPSPSSPMPSSLRRWVPPITPCDPAPGSPWIATANTCESTSTHVSSTGTVRSGWTTPPPSYMHGHYLYDRPSMVGP